MKFNDLFAQVDNDQKALATATAAEADATAALKTAATSYSTSDAAVATAVAKAGEDGVLRTLPDNSMRLYKTLGPATYRTYSPLMGDAEVPADPPTN